MRHKVSEDRCRQSVADGPIRTRATKFCFWPDETRSDRDVLGSLQHIKPISPENSQRKPEEIRKKDSPKERNFEMTARSKRTEAEPRASFGKHLRAIPFLLCALLLFFTASATAQSAPLSPAADSIVWGVYDNVSGDWVVWSDDSVDVNSVVWGEDGSDPDAPSPDSVVWGIQ